MPANPRRKSSPDKPTLYTLPGPDALDLNNLAAFFEKITRRKPTPQEMADAKKTLRGKA